MGRLSTSILLLTVAGACCAQPFGRFGYNPFPSVPGFRITADGFRSSSGGADTLRFVRPLQGFKAYKVSDRTALFTGPRFALAPQKFRVDLRSPGFEMYFPYGFQFNVSSLRNPFLSWSEGSVGPDVPTPESKWVLVTFQDRQPPIMLVFDKVPSGVVVRGSAGQWRIETTGHYEGWIRFCLPLGHYARPGMSAASLGRIVQDVMRNDTFWTGQAPSLVDFEIRSDEESITAVWTFDGPGAIIPPAALLASTGGYAVKVLSGVKNTQADLWDGPTSYAAGPKIAIRFPMRRIPSGRSLTVGAAPAGLAESASPFDLPSLSELALASLLAASGGNVHGAADAATALFVGQAPFALEPHTRQSLPFTATGDGLDLAAANALLVQTRLAAAGRPSDGNTLYAATVKRLDWYSWLVWSDDQRVSRRASAMLAIAGALCQEPERRLEAAMLQAGLAAERALALYRARRGFPERRNDLIEPLYTVRMGLYMTGPSLFVDSLMSEVRLLTGEQATAQSTPDGLRLSWRPVNGEPGEMRFFVGRPVTAVAVSNLESLKVEQSLGTLTLRYDPAEEGECVVMLMSPGWTYPLPNFVAPPRYTEHR